MWNKVLFFLFFSLGVHAGEFPKRVSSILIEGNERTHSEVILNELLFSPGDRVEQSQVSESYQRVVNTRLFSDVDFEWKNLDDQRSELRIKVQEVWTLNPIIQVTGGSRLRRYTLGVVDQNFLGKFQTLGGWYDNIAGASSGALWFKEPRFLNQFLLLHIDLRMTRRIRSLYQENNIYEGAFTSKISQFSAYLEKQIRPRFAFGGGIYLNYEQYSQDLLSEAQKDSVDSSGFTFPRNGRLFFVRGTLKFGRIDFYSYLKHGFLTELRVDQTVSLLGSEFDFTRIQLQNQSFIRFGDDMNLGFQYSLGTISRNRIQHQFFLGGLSEVRGYLDGRIRGSNFWQANVEYRIHSFNHLWLTLQHVFFLDLANTASSFLQLFKFDQNPMSSLGLGMRFFSRKFPGFLLRIDYAWALDSRGFNGLAFGGSHFF